jgi:16S rRNA (guanine527-N7)-methyltransferase
MPLVAATGVLLAMKGSSAAEEIASAEPTLRELGCAEPELLHVTAPDGSSTATVVRVAHGQPTRLG